MNDAMREAVIGHNMEVLYYLTMQPGNHIELMTALFIVLCILTIAISKIHLLGKAGSSSLLLSLFSVAVCSFFLVQVASFSKVWALPELPTGINETAVILAGTLLAFLFIVVPFTRIVLRSGYFLSLTAWLMGLFITGAAVYLFSMTYEKPRSGQTPLDTLESVKHQMEKALDNVPVPAP
ncbi:MAG: hypothetical protein ACFCUX_04550 [Candidatus Methylacidiphilales bacterium]